MKYILLLCAVVTTACAQTNVAVRVRVTGDNVSLRAKPGLQGELLERAMRGEELIYCGETNGWVAVQMPVAVDCWVSAEYIQEGAVEPGKLNVRSGPSLNYSVVGVLTRGDKVEVRDEFNGWLKIVPPAGSRVWISADYVEKIEQPEPEIVPDPVPEPEGEPAPPADEVGGIDKSLPTLVLDKLDESKPQGREKRLSGVLRRANPGLYRLVLPEESMEESICLVRGSEAQLNELLSRYITVEGRIYWAENVDLPVIVPAKIYINPAK
ncbi:MAG TPA: SH3 domain-containing protein [Pontiella sp.]